MPEKEEGTERSLICLCAYETPVAGRTGPGQRQEGPECHPGLLCSEWKLGFAICNPLPSAFSAWELSGKPKAHCLPGSPT